MSNTNSSRTGHWESASSTGMVAGARPTKRNRITLACTTCRQRKSRCDGLRPKCTNCETHQHDCVYANSAHLTKDSASKVILSRFESRLAFLESSVTGLLGKVARLEGQGATDTDEYNGGCQPHSPLPPDPLEGGPREEQAAEIQDATDGIGSVVSKNEGDSGFFGPSSNIAFTHLIIRTTAVILKKAAPEASPVSPNDAALQSHMLQVSCLPPPSINHFKISGDIAMGTEPYVLPPEEETLRLIDTFFQSTGLIFPCIDRDEFFSTYRKLVATNFSAVRRAWLGVLNMVLAIATSSNLDTNSALTASEITTRSEKFFSRAFALCDAQIKHGASLEVVHLLLLIILYLQGTERSIETWNAHGFAVKIAYQLGLHSADALKQYSRKEQEYRKRTWFGCIVIDRILCMTMGRPPSIPEHFIKLDLPCAMAVDQTWGTKNQEYTFEVLSVDFFTSTITLYKIMGDVCDVLYGSNLGCGVPTDIFELGSLLMQYEQKFSAWQRQLPDTMHLITPDDLTSSSDSSDVLRFRVVLTLQFLNLRILTHRPLLCKYLELLGNPQVDAQQILTLHRVGANSMLVCVQSAAMIIKITRNSLTDYNRPSQPIGAWWFTLYYAFNAALVIYSALLVQYQTKQHIHSIVDSSIVLSMETLQEAIECLSLIFEGNVMTEKCVRYTSALTRLLCIICRSNKTLDFDPAKLPTNILGDTLSQSNFMDTQSYDNFDIFDIADLQMGTNWDYLSNTTNFIFQP